MERIQHEIKEMGLQILKVQQKEFLTQEILNGECTVHENVFKTMIMISVHLPYLRVYKPQVCISCT
jgi:hypothetical protein